MLIAAQHLTRGMRVVTLDGPPALVWASEARNDYDDPDGQRWFIALEQSVSTARLTPSDEVGFYEGESRCWNRTRLIEVADA